MDTYLMYLRKSRKDREQELQTGQFDTLQRHRDALLALAARQGYPVLHIFEEVVSGDTIAERPQMHLLLSAVETGAYAGVLVMEVARLARGNTRDQGTVAETFQYSGTKIITPDKIYDPADEADEEYFEFGLFMSRREYKAINRRLQRGRLASLEEGKYVAGTPPYGYRKVKLPRQKGYTLELVPETADVVRTIFQLYTAGDPRPDGTRTPIGSFGIANLLNARGVPSPGGGTWSASSVRDILKNPTYAGYLRWSHRPDKKQMVAGSVVVSHPVNKEMPLRRGIHPPIVPESLWTAAMAAMAGRSHASVPGGRRLANPLAGLLRCSVCGRSLVQLPQGGRGGPMVLCPTAKCPTVASRREVVEAALLKALGRWLKDVPLLQPETGEAEAVPGLQAAERDLARARRALAALAQQRDRLYDLLEQGVYSQEVFSSRLDLLNGRTAQARAQVETLSGHLQSLQNFRPAPLAPAVRSLPALYQALETPGEQNALLKAVLDRVVYCKSAGGQWQPSDLTLYLYPKIAPPADGL